MEGAGQLPSGGMPSLGRSKSEILSGSALRLGSLQSTSGTQTCKPLRSEISSWERPRQPGLWTCPPGPVALPELWLPSCWDSDQDLMKVSGLWVSTCGARPGHTAGPWPAEVSFSPGPCSFSSLLFHEEGVCSTYHHTSASEGMALGPKFQHGTVIALVTRHVLRLQRGRAIGKLQSIRGG